MTRSHRSVHRWLWAALTLLVTLGFTMALGLRPPAEPSQTVQESQP